MSSNLGDLVVRVGADVSGFAAGMSTVSGQLSAVDKEAQKAGAGFTKLGGTLTGIGTGISAAVTLPILGAGLAATKFSSDFELGMRKVTSLIGGATQKEFSDLSAATLKLAKDMGIDAVGATNALYEAISAGIPKENALDFVRVASVAAVAGLTDSKIAVNALTTVIAAYGLQTTEAKELSDAMFQAVNIGKFQFADLAAEIGPAAQMSSALGVSYQELLAATATLSITTGSAGKAVTQVESAMRALLNPTAEMAAAFKSIEVASGSAAIKAFGFEGVLQKLRVATGGNVEAFTQLFGRIEGSQGALGLTGEKAATAAKDLDTMRHASDGLGAATVAYNEINKSTQRQLEMTLNQLKATAIEMGQALLPAVNSLLKASQPLLGALADMVSWFAKLPSGAQSAAIGMAALAAAVGPLVIMAGQTSIAIGGIVKAASLLGPTLLYVGPAISSFLLSMVTMTASLSWLLVPLVAVAAVFAATWGIDKVSTEVERLDSSMSEAATKTEALRIAQLSAGDSTGKLSSAFDGAIPHNLRYAESLGMSTEAADRFYERWKGLDEAIGAGTVDFLLAAKVVDDYNASVKGLPEELRKAHDEQIKANAAMKQGVASVTPLTLGTVDLSKSFQGMTGAANITNAAVRKQFDALKAGKPVTLDLSGAVKTLTSSTKAGAVVNQTAAEKSKALKDETDRLKKANDQYAAGLKAIFAENSKHNAKLIELGISTRAAKDQSAMFAEYLKTGVVPAANAVQTGMKDVDDAFKKFRQSLIDGDTAEKAMTESMKELAKAGPPVSDALQKIFDQIEKADTAASGINKLGDAYKALGITTSASLKQAAVDAEKAYADMMAAGGVSTYEQQQGIVRVADAHKALLESVGKWTPAMEESYQASKRALDGMEGDVKKVESAWKKMGDSVKDALKGFQSNINTGLISSLFGFDRRAFNKDLDEQASDLKESLGEQTSEWDKYQVSATQSLGAIRSNAASDLAEIGQDLARSLQDAETSWSEYADNATKGLDEFRADNAKGLDDDLSDLKKNLTKQTAAYKQHVRDINVALGRAGEDTEDRIKEETTDTKRGIADKQTAFDRYQRDTLQKIDELTAEDASGNAEQVRNLREALADKAIDLRLYISRANDDLAEFTSDAKIEEDRKLADLKTSLADRTTEYETYVAENKLQMADAASSHAAKLAKEELAVSTSMTARKAEYETFKTDAVAKFDALKTEIAAKLTGEETDLAASLSARKLEYDAYVTDINAKLATLKEDHRTIWDDIGSLMKGAFTDLGAEIARITLEIIEGKFIKALTGMLAGDGVIESLKGAFGGLGKTISGAFGGGGHGVTDVANLPGQMPGAIGDAGGAAGGIGGAVSGAGSGASSAIGGVAGAFNIAGAIGSLVGAGAAVAGDVILARIHTDTGRIEESTRYTKMYLGGAGGEGGMAWTLNWILAALEWGGPMATLLDNIKTVTMNELFELPMKLDRIGLGTDAIALNTAAFASSGGPSITINIDGNVIGNTDFLDSLANALVGKLRLQGVTG